LLSNRMDHDETSSLPVACSVESLPKGGTGNDSVSPFFSELSEYCNDVKSVNGRVLIIDGAETDASLDTREVCKLNNNNSRR
jgi:hypothetical protein